VTHHRFIHALPIRVRFAEDVAYALRVLQIRQYDQHGNLRKAGG
jgi:hypothetical protein